MQPAQSIAMRLARGDTFLNGSDSLVASSPAHHFATQAGENVALYSAQASTQPPQRPPPATKPPKGGKDNGGKGNGAKGKPSKGDKYGGVKNQVANGCTWFNFGSCNKPAFGCVCPSNPAKLHTCSKCGSDTHAATDCKSGQKTKQQQQQQQQWGGQPQSKKHRRGKNSNPTG